MSGHARPRGAGLPRPVAIALGTACVLLGAVLVADPFRSLTALAWVVGGSLVLTGVGELFGSDQVFGRLAGLAWIVGGLLALAWPGITIVVLALASGVALIVGGLLKLVEVILGRRADRLIGLLLGVSNVMVGGLALSWPTITVFVLAVAFGLRTIFFGLALCVPRADAGAWLSRLPRPIRLVSAVLVLALIATGAVFSISIHRAKPAEPGEFYTAPTSLPAGLGTLIRKEIINGFFPGTTTYRVLYTSTGYRGQPVAVSGLIIIPASEAPPGGRKVVAYTHGTVGVATNCSNSLQGPAWAPGIEGLAEFVKAGYVIAATDYQGLGTPGPHPYLVGDAEGKNELDNVRAAVSLPEAKASKDFAVWGHSQGGHAALFTGQLAAAYAPELHLVAVAAGAPVPDLVELFKVNVQTTIGKVLISMALASWEQVYDDAQLNQIVTPAARPVVRKIAQNCLYDSKQILASVPGSLALSLTFLSNPPWDTEPWKTIVATNNPGNAATGVPILITQGEVDPIVAPEETGALVKRLCDRGERVTYKTYPGIAHLDAGLVAAQDVAQWIADQFAGRPATTSCSN